jgi:hypothetical protein
LKRVGPLLVGFMRIREVQKICRSTRRTSRKWCSILGQKRVERRHGALRLAEVLLDKYPPFAIKHSSSNILSGCVNTLFFSVAAVSGRSQQAQCLLNRQLSWDRCQDVAVTALTPLGRDKIFFVWGSVSTLLRSRDSRLYRLDHLNRYRK